MLPGLDTKGRSICVDCAGIPAQFHCETCHEERPRYRRGTCARCSLRADLAHLLAPDGTAKPASTALLDALVTAARPESIITWMRHPGVIDVLTQLGTGTLSPTHEAFDALPPGRHIEHIRAILIDTGQLPPRDDALARFERWLDDKLAPITDTTMRRPVEQFARWHHLRSIRNRSSPSTTSQAATHNAKQEIAAITFLTWLKDDANHTLATCTQSDIDRWLSSGPTTRSTIRTFIVFAVNERLSPPRVVPHRSARSSRRLTPEDRLDGIRNCLENTTIPVPTRVAALLLLLFAQPLSRVCSLTTTAVQREQTGMMITFDAQPVELPAVFATLIEQHLTDRSPARMRSTDHSPWLFPGSKAGHHITHSYLLTQIRELGLNPLATRNRALYDLVTAMPAPLVADLFAYSYQVTTKHANENAVEFATYAGRQQ
jgi:hypothetical protein